MEGINKRDQLQARYVMLHEKLSEVTNILKDVHEISGIDTDLKSFLELQESFNKVLNDVVTIRDLQDVVGEINIPSSKKK